MNILRPSLSVAAALLVSASMLHAQTTAVTDPVGFMTIDTPQGSDTIIAAPVTKAPVFQGTVASVSGRTLTFNPSPNFASLTDAPHYVQAANGAQAGMIFDVASNTGNTIVLADNGVNPAGLNAASVKVVPYWTIGELYPAADQGVSFTPSGAAVPLRRTQILLPDVAGNGANRAPGATYYFVTNASAPTDPQVSYWRSTTVAGNMDNTPILPDSYFTVRQTTNSAAGLKTTIAGSVNVNPMVAQLDSTGAANDNYVSLGRPVDIKLNDLGLIESGAFLASAGTVLPQRRDQLLIINNDTVGINKAPSKTYYYVTGQGWKEATSGTTDVGNDVIKGATGYIIRKAAQNPVGTTFWTNNISIAE